MGFRGYFNSHQDIKDKVVRIIDKSTQAERAYIKDKKFEFSKEELSISVHVVKLDLDKIITGYEDIYLEEDLKPIYRQMK